MKKKWKISAVGLIGEVRGIKKGESRLNKLYGSLLKDGRIEDLQKAISDESYMEKLYKEYGL